MATKKFSSRQSFQRGLIIFLGLIALWWAIAVLFKIPQFILPAPDSVAKALWNGRLYLWGHTLITLTEIILGFFFGVFFGALIALLLMASQRLQRWLMPVLLISQSIPIFALAPILVLWLGFGMASKIIAAMLVIFFPVTTAFFDGLRRTDNGFIDLAKTMGASPLNTLFQLRMMAALPAFASGVRVAAAAAPIGAIIGEWVGSSGGLGYVMLNANARMQTPTCFAALFILSVIAIFIWKVVDILLKKMIYWVPDQYDSENEAEAYQ